jgi:small-conductance mechanosensitive channel
MILSQPVLIASSSSPFVWQEVRVRVTFQRDWRRAEEVRREVGEALHAEVEPDLAAAFRNLERRYAFKYGTLTPIVYVALGEHGVELTLRLLVHLRKRRAAIDKVSRRVLDALAAEPALRIAYATYQVKLDDRAGMNEVL